MVIYLPLSKIEFTMDFIQLSEPDIIRILGERFKDYRLSVRLTQKELSEKTGASHKTISLFETGRGRNITMQNFLTLLRAVGMLQNIGELLPELPSSPYLIQSQMKRKSRIRRGVEDKK